ncbi:MAG: flagellar biosynthetic protein FliR, partial [Planctomycetota bacterium]
SSYSFVPIGQEFDFSVVYLNIHEMLRRALELGLMYAAPIFAVMILLTVTLVVLARAVQNINLMEFSFGLRILLALVASVYFLEEGGPFLERVFVAIFSEARLLFAGA